MVEVASSKNATLRAFSSPQQSEGARRGQSPEAMAIEDNLAGPTKHKRARFKWAFLCSPARRGLPLLSTGKTQKLHYRREARCEISY